ncbi:MAG: PAS domain-containing protein [Gemmatimonadaceae bacterium]|nr:PAS domain-containing protein [Gemmatimonadaceae bacterium]
MDDPSLQRADLTAASESLSFLAGGGEMGERIRAFDWTQTPLGAPKTWRASLRTALQILLTTNHPVFIFWGPSHSCFYNDAYARSLGPEQHPGILGLDGLQAWTAIWPIIGPQIDLVMLGKGATWHENQLIPITRFGAVDDVYWTYSYGPIHDDGAPHGVGGVLVLCTETTTAMRSEATQRADATKWRTLFEQSPGFICVLRGPEHRFEYGNPQYCALIGRDQMPVGLTVAEALPEVVEQGYIELLDEVLRSGESHSAYGASVVLSDVERFVDFVYQPIFEEDGAVSGILVQGFDVTERELAQTRLAETAARLQLATDAAEIGIHEFDFASGHIEWDARVRRLWGVSPDVDITYQIFIDGVVEADHVVTQTAFDRALDPKNDGVYQAEYRVRDRDGNVRWIRATGHVFFDGATPRRLVGTVQDISRQKFDQVKLIDTDRRKDIFLATLAHELRNPLAPIRNAAQILSMPGIGAGEVTWAQEVIARQSKHMASLLDDLLDIARLTQGRLALQRESLDIRAVLDTAVVTIRPQLEAKHHRLQIDSPDVGVFIYCDSMRLCQVFANLLANSIKYMEAGGSIGVKVTTNADALTVTITDTGVGMSAETLAEVFGMFRQSAASLERAEGGLGIGLALVRAVVELHGGRVGAVSDGLGTGSTFSVTLPLNTPILA